ncbi:response regulator transcription factor [Rhizobiaceae sp. 2RAB30]
MADEQSLVYVIDDDASVRAGLDRLLRSVGLSVMSFASTREFMQATRPDLPSCLVLDIRMPGQGGLEFQREFAAAGDTLPVIFITGHGDVPMAVQAMKAGAVEFLSKPFREQDLLDAINLAIEKDRSRRREVAVERDLRERFATLAPGEVAVMELVVTGLLNKQIAGMLKLSEITVKVRRGQVMRKMRAGSLAALVRMADRLGMRSEAN